MFRGVLANVNSHFRLFQITGYLWLLIFLTANPGWSQDGGARRTFQVQSDSVIILRPRFLPGQDTLLSFLPQKELYRLRIGVALSGGGARGISQIGVLQVLEENNIPIDAIVGTSMGSIIGGLYAAGYSPEELAAIIKSIQWQQILRDKPSRRNLFIGKKQEQDRLLFQIRLDGLKPYIPPALTPGQRLQTILSELAMNSLYASSISFDRFRIPFRAISTDLYSGEKVVLAEGDLAEAMRASLSFPLLFTPVPLNGKLLVDGGLLDNIPVDEVRRLGVDMVIAVDASSNLRKPGQLNAPWEIADQVTSIMQRDRSQLSREKADVLIRVNDPDRTNIDFSDIDGLIALGRQEALRQLPRIQDEIRRFEAVKYRELDQSQIFISRVETVPARLHVSFHSLNNGHNDRLQLSYADILHQLEALYRQGIYTDVFAELIDRPEGALLRIVAKEAPVLKAIRFVGRHVIAEDTLKAIVQPLLQRPLNPHRTRHYMERVLKKYRQEGYSLASITKLEYDPQNGTGTVYIDEGRIQTIQIEGNERTRDHVVLREFTLKPGDIFNFHKARRGINNIYSTGLFQRVGMSIRRQTNHVQVIIKLQEHKYHVLGLSFRSDSERKSRTYLELTEENLLGLGAQLSLQTEIGERDRFIQSRFSMERIFKTYLTLNVQNYWIWRQNLQYQQGIRLPVGEYTESQIGATLSLGQLMRKLGVVSLELHLDRYDIRRVRGGGYPVRSYLLNRLVFRSIVDTRDKIPFPKRGRYIHFYYDFASKQLKSDYSFNRMFISAETFLTLQRRHTFRGRFMLGTADLTTPFPLFFRIGGSDYFFGLRDQEWSGRSFWIFNGGYRYSLPAKSYLTMHFGLRYDAGGFWLNPEAINYHNIRKAIGGFVAFETPLGAFEVAYGRMDTGQERFYVTLGYKF